MKQKHPRSKTPRKATAFLLLCFALSAATEMNAQTKSNHTGTDQIIESLHKSPNARHAVDATDKSLIEKALSSPEFADRLATHRGTVYVMMHGLEFEKIQGITAAGNPVELLDKASITEKNPQMFFILKDLQRTPEVAYVDLVMHYDFDGSYEKSISAEMLLAHTGGEWEKQNLQTKTTR